MKVLTALPISLDRISTREELEEVLHLLTDPLATDNCVIFVPQDPADPLLIDWCAELERDENSVGNRAVSEDEDEDEGHPSQPHEKLMDLLLQMNKPTN